MSCREDIPSLTSEGWNRIIDFVNQYSDEPSKAREALVEGLGADIIGKSHVYSFPRRHEGVDLVTEGMGDEFVLKICSNCLKGQSYSRCFVEQEAWVWNEAVRRGDEDLFAPIIAVDDRYRWLVMVKAEYLTESKEVSHIWSSEDGVSAKDRSQQFMDSFGRRGWITYDAEVMAVEDRPVVIDYEDVFHEGVYEGLYFQSFNGFSEDRNFSGQSRQAIDKWEAMLFTDPVIGPSGRPVTRSDSDLL